MVGVTTKIDNPDKEHNGEVSHASNETSFNGQQIDRKSTVKVGSISIQQGIVLQVIPRLKTTAGFIRP